MIKNITSGLLLMWYSYDEWLAQLTESAALGQIPIGVWLGVAVPSALVLVFSAVVAGAAMAKSS
jgi:TRAP-type C4-dicarboxylate transport system permease small subunit